MRARSLTRVLQASDKMPLRYVVKMGVFSVIKGKKNLAFYVYKFTKIIYYSSTLIKTILTTSYLVKITL